MAEVSAVLKDVDGYYSSKRALAFCGFVVAAGLAVLGQFTTHAADLSVIGLFLAFSGGCVGFSWAERLPEVLAALRKPGGAG